MSTSADQVGASTARAMPWPLIVAACLGMFAVTASGSSRAPLLIDMAADLEVTLPMVANLFGVTSVAWGVSSYAAGRASDRWGRRIFMVGSLITLFAALTAVSLSAHFYAVIAWVTLAGLCCGAHTGTVMAEIAIRVHDSQRGRALGWVMTGQSLTLLIGVPLAAWLGASSGWRGVHVYMAGLALIAALALYLTTKPQGGAAAKATQASPTIPLRDALTPSVLCLLASLVAERICFGLAAFYYPAYLRTAHDLELQDVAMPLFVYALGNILGTILGGQLADRFPNRRLSYATTLLLAGATGLAWFMWHPTVLTTVVLGFVFALFNALARPSLMAALAEVPEQVRGTVMGLNGSMASVGWLTAAMGGGWLFATAGFESFGLAIAAATVIGAVLALLVPRGS